MHFFLALLGLNKIKTSLGIVSTLGRDKRFLCVICDYFLTLLFKNSLGAQTIRIIKTLFLVDVPTPYARVWMVYND